MMICLIYYLHEAPSLWVLRGKIWKFVILDCWKIYLQAPEQLRMSLGNNGRNL